MKVLLWFDFPKCNTFHVSELNSIWHSLAHLPSQSKSHSTCCDNLVHCLQDQLFILMSSPNLLAMPLTFSSEWFIKMMRNNWPNTNPYGLWHTTRHRHPKCSLLPCNLQSCPAYNLAKVCIDIVHCLASSILFVTSSTN